jgi:predicted transcriptional regulator
MERKVEKMERSSVEMGYKSVLGWGNRGWLEIIDLILAVCEHGALKTHIMYKCNLNSKQVQQYLDFVVGRGLVVSSHDAEDPKRTLYTTTDRGKKLIRAYNELADIFSFQNPNIDV